MCKEAQEHASEDAKRRQIVEAQNKADQVIYSTQNMLKEYGSKLSEADKSAVNAALAELQSVAKSDDPAKIESAIDKVNRACHELARVMYQQATTQQAGPQAGGPGFQAGPQAQSRDTQSKGGDDVIDADYTVKG